MRNLGALSIKVLCTALRNHLFDRPLSPHPHIYLGGPPERIADGWGGMEIRLRGLDMQQRGGTYYRVVSQAGFLTGSLSRRHVVLYATVCGWMVIMMDAFIIGFWARKESSPIKRLPACYPVTFDFPAFRRATNPDFLLRTTSALPRNFETPFNPFSPLVASRIYSTYLLAQAVSLLATVTYFSQDRNGFPTKGPLLDAHVVLKLAREILT